VLNRNLLPADVHMNAFVDTIGFAQASEVNWPRDPFAEPADGQVPFGVHHNDPAPWNVLRGPVHAHSGVAGIILQHGREVAVWGDPDRADLTFSVAKTYLALLAGVAHGCGLLPDTHEPVVARVPGIGFDAGHNREITWAHLLEQTSEWEGSCFGLPDTVDRYRVVSHDPRPVAGRKGDARPLQSPGAYWEYNDVRINQLSLALLHLFRRPLPEVFRDTILKPLGAGENFAWRGYDDAWTEIVGSTDGVKRKMQSVPGGTHWGGGVSISARDQAKIGQLLLDNGACGGEQLIPASWAQRMRQPCAIAPFYGWLMWLNTDGTQFPGASKDASFMIGAGGHYTWIEPAHDAVIVVRWLDSAHAPKFIELTAKALLQLS
jgi:CubicO group peptidase (beta-lactamase class C family)